VEKKRYELIGMVVITSWFNNKRGFARLKIVTDEKGLNKIVEEPLQDYLGEGVKKVDYVKFDVYTVSVTTTEDKIIEERPIRPDFTIEAGEYNLTPEEEEQLCNTKEYVIEY